MDLIVEKIFQRFEERLNLYNVNELRFIARYKIITV